MVKCCNRKLQGMTEAEGRNDLLLLFWEMRILICPSYEFPANIEADSSYTFMSQFVDVAATYEDVFVYWLLPSHVSFRDDVKHEKIVVPFQKDRDSNELLIPDLSPFDPALSYRPVDVVLTNNAGKALYLANWFNLRAYGRKEIPMFVWDFSTKYKGCDEMPLILWQNLANHAMGYAVSHNVFFTPFSYDKALENVRRFCSSVMVKTFMEKSQCLLARVNSRRLFDSIDGLKKYDKFACYFGGRFTATKGAPEIIEQYDLLFRSGRNILIKITTDSSTTVSSALEGKGEAEVFRGLRQADAWRIMTKCHVSIFWQSLKMGPAAPYEQILAGLVVLVRDTGHEVDLLPPDYPFLFSTKMDCATMLRWVYDNYERASEMMVPAKQWVLENTDVIELLPKMIADMRLVLPAKRKKEGGTIQVLVDDCVKGRRRISLENLLQEISDRAAVPTMLFGRAHGHPRMLVCELVNDYLWEFSDTCDSAIPIYQRVLG